MYMDMDVLEIMLAIELKRQNEVLGVLSLFPSPPPTHTHAHAHTLIASSFL